MFNRRNCRNFSRDSSGAAAVEFAIVSVPFLAIVGFILQMSLVFFFRQSIEFATMEGARSIRSGQVQALGMSVEQFKTQVICPKLIALSCASLVVQVRRVEKTWNAKRDTGTYSFIDLQNMRLKPGVWEQSKSVFCPGGSGELILVDVTYKLPVLVSLVWPGSPESDGAPTASLRWASLVMNEPFTTAPGKSC